MDIGDIGKAGIVGGVLAIVLEFLVGWAAPGIAYTFGFVAMLVGGFVAGWMDNGELMDGAVAGIVAGLIYVILGLFIIFPMVSSYKSVNPVAAIIVGIVIGAIGGVVGNYLSGSKKGSSKPAPRRKR